MGVGQSCSTDLMNEFTTGTQLADTAVIPELVLSRTLQELGFLCTEWGTVWDATGGCRQASAPLCLHQYLKKNLYLNIG